MKEAAISRKPNSKKGRPVHQDGDKGLKPVSTAHA